VQETNLFVCVNNKVQCLTVVFVGTEIVQFNLPPSCRRANWQGKVSNKLKTLDLCYASVRDSHVTQLTHLPALEELNFDSCPIGDAAIAHLAERNVVPNLLSLDLADTDITDVGMAHIARFTQLTRLSLFYCNITNNGLKHVAKLEFLEALNLDSREISNEGLVYLKELRNLKHLDIFSARVTDTGCGHLAMIHSLESLELCGGGVGDMGCSFLASLENLRSLNLSQNERISNRGAVALAVLTNLRALNLSNTRVNAAAVPFFSGLFHLQSLALYGCPGIEYNDPNLHRLQNKLPNLKCLRLHSSSDQDGRMLQDGMDLGDDDRSIAEDVVGDPDDDNSTFMITQDSELFDNAAEWDIDVHLEQPILANIDALGIDAVGDDNIDEIDTEIQEGDDELYSDHD
jgi:hypothetical protein